MNPCLRLDTNDWPLLNNPSKGPQIAICFKDLYCICCCRCFFCCFYLFFVKIDRILSRMCRGCSPTTPRHFWAIFWGKNMSSNMSIFCWKALFAKVDLIWQLWPIPLKRKTRILIIFLSCVQPNLVKT